MLNKVMLIGRLGRDPELRYTQAGKAVCSLSVATDESFKDAQGAKVQRTEWHKVILWDKLAENCAQYLAIGSLAYFEGKLQTRKWQDNQGQDRYSTEIQAQRVQFLDSKQSDTPPAQTKERKAHEDLGPAFPSEKNDWPDDLPF